MVQLIQGINWVTQSKIKRSSNWTPSYGDTFYDLKNKRLYNNAMCVWQMGHSAK